MVNGLSSRELNKIPPLGSGRHAMTPGSPSWIIESFVCERSEIFVLKYWWDVWNTSKNSTTRYRLRMQSSIWRRRKDRYMVFIYVSWSATWSVYITFFNQMVVKDSKGTLACLPASPRVLELSLSFTWSIIVSFVRHRANLNLHWRLAASCSRRPALKFLNWIL